MVFFNLYFYVKGRVQQETDEGLGGDDFFYYLDKMWWSQGNGSKEFFFGVFEGGVMSIGRGFCER